MRAGFTLIELLVVVAIIGILSSVALASLNSARTKAADAAIKGIASQIRSQAEIDRDSIVGAGYSSSGPSRGTCSTLVDVTPEIIFETAKIVKMVADAVSKSGKSNTYCAVDSSSYAMYLPLKSNKYLCIDSGGTTQDTCTSNCVFTSNIGPYACP